MPLSGDFSKRCLICYIGVCVSTHQSLIGVWYTSSNIPLHTVVILHWLSNQIAPVDFDLSIMRYANSFWYYNCSALGND